MFFNYNKEVACKNKKKLVIRDLQKALLDSGHLGFSRNFEL